MDKEPASDDLGESADAIIAILDPVCSDPLDRDELLLILADFKDINGELSAMRLTRWAEANNKRITNPGSFFERWLREDRKKVAQQREQAKKAAKVIGSAPRDHRNAPPEQREAWMRSNVQDFVEQTVFLQESFGSWEREQHEATGEYADRLQPKRRAKIRGEVVHRWLIEGNRWTVGVPQDIEWETAEFEQKDRRRLGLPLMDEPEVRRRFRNLGQIGPKDREYTLLLPPKEGTQRGDDTNLNKVKAIARHPKHSQQREVARQALREAGESW